MNETGKGVWLSNILNQRVIDFDESKRDIPHVNVSMLFEAI